jgi:hypothetical protein
LRGRLGGIAFEVGPDELLEPVERAVLSKLDRGEGAARRLRLMLEKPPPPPLGREGSTAIVECEQDVVSITHPAFTARIDPGQATASLTRDPRVPFALALTLRTAMMARLPLEGGVALHAAGIVRGGQGVAFFGPSGAGKSTLAALSPHPVLSDELVAVVRGQAFGLAATGVWGTLGERPAPPGIHPLGALVELAKGPRFALERLAPAVARRRLLLVAMVPLAPPLWAAALQVTAALAEAVPVYRMAWTPAEPPWRALAEELAAAPAGALR